MAEQLIVDVVAVALQEQELALGPGVPNPDRVVVGSRGQAFPARAKDVQEVDWWSNRTASSNVEDVILAGQGEYLRLGAATSGFVEGELALSGSFLIIRERIHGVQASAASFPSGDKVRLFIGAGLVHEYTGLTANQASMQEVLVWAIQPQTNSMPYRIEFESPTAVPSTHPIVLRGRVARRLTDISIGRIRCALTPNSVGSGVILLAMGSRSVSTNDFTLTSAGGPPDQLGLLFYRPDSQRLP